jgi:hypothetical protein
MSRKRFTDADKWEDGWFCEQPCPIKLFWIYLCDRCDHAGVWEINWKLARFHLGDIDQPAIEKALADRVTVIAGGRRWFVRGFIKFQYPTGLSLTSPAHKRIRSTMQSHGINPDTLVCTLQSRVAHTPEDKDEDKDKDSSSNAEDIFDPQALAWAKAIMTADAAPKPTLPQAKSFTDFRAVHGRCFIGKDERPDWEALYRAYEWDAMHEMHEALKDERIYLNAATAWLSKHYRITE